MKITELCTISGIVKTEKDTRSFKDERCKVDRYTAAYFGQRTGAEYRVSMETEREGHVSFPDFIERSF